ncbi:alginate export family protein [Verrucomicrobiaceae bacterium R5-34]|nr:alginate export family protein [Verrucomicrobiaceae bacterium R5-34]
MRYHTPLLAALLSSSLSHAGEPSLPAETVAHPDAFELITPTLDLRTRFEAREQDGYDASTAWTTRARLGLKTAEFSGFSAFVEGEANLVLGSDYRSNPTGDSSTYPYVDGNTVISDPRSFELNRAWVQYQQGDWAAKVGRQRMIRNNAAFIGNVGWRQNEQTFDAIQLSYTEEAFSISYAYSDRVQRIFGDEANDGLPGPPLHDFEGEFHLLDATYQIADATLGGYVYLIDVENNSNVGESNTFGAFYKSACFHAEWAYQEGESALFAGGDYDAFYGHLIFSHQIDKATFSAGVEYMEEGFKTPFATVHAFNGFADAFILNRIGLTNSGGAYEGITDFYVGYTQGGLPWNMTFKGFLHYFMDDSMDGSYGWEVDAVLIKPFNKQLKGILKATYFDADDDGPFSDIEQVSVELNYSF